MDKIKANLPNLSQNACFWYVGPIPRNNPVRLDGDKPIYTFCDGKKELAVKLIDYLVYKTSFLSEIHCMAAYGFTIKQMRNWILDKFRLQGDDKVAFYLFQTLPDQKPVENTADILSQQPKSHSISGLIN
jgi:hypothetical protein